MVITPLCSRRRRVPRRNNLLDNDVRHVASYLFAAKIHYLLEITKNMFRKTIIFNICSVK